MEVLEVLIVTPSSKQGHGYAITQDKANPLLHNFVAEIIEPDGECHNTHENLSLGQALIQVGKWVDESPMPYDIDSGWSGL